MMRLVFDTDVVVAAMRSPKGASAALILAALDARVTLLANVALILEYEAVCTRADQCVAAGIDTKRARQYVDALASLAEPVYSHFTWRPQLKDAADEMVLEAAVNGGAAAIVSFNHKDYAEVPKRFGVRLLLPRQAIQEILS